MSVKIIQICQNGCPPPPLCWGTLCFSFANIVHVIVVNYEHRAVYEHYNVVGKGPDSVVKSSGAIYRFN